MTQEIKSLTERVDKNIERIEQGQKTQGERIGSMEKSIHQIERNEKDITKYAKKLDDIEKAPGEKWNKFTWLIFAGVVTAIVAFIMGKLL